MNKYFVIWLEFMAFLTGAAVFVVVPLYLMASTEHAAWLIVWFFSLPTFIVLCMWRSDTRKSYD